MTQVANEVDDRAAGCSSGTTGPPASDTAVRWAARHRGPARRAAARACGPGACSTHPTGRRPSGRLRAAADGLRARRPRRARAAGGSAGPARRGAAATSCTATPPPRCSTRPRNADLLVVGPRGSGGFRGLGFGSTADQVARHAPCPVRRGAGRRPRRVTESDPAHAQRPPGAARVGADRCRRRSPGPPTWRSSSTCCRSPRRSRSPSTGASPCSRFRWGDDRAAAYAEEHDATLAREPARCRCVGRPVSLSTGVAADGHRPRSGWCCRRRTGRTICAVLAETGASREVAVRLDRAAVDVDLEAHPVVARRRRRPGPAETVTSAVVPVWGP